MAETLKQTVDRLTDSLCIVTGRDTCSRRLEYRAHLQAAIRAALAEPTPEMIECRLGDREVWNAMAAERLKEIE